jgi:hypothetical protein
MKLRRNPTRSMRRKLKEKERKTSVEREKQCDKYKIMEIITKKKNSMV